MLDTSGCLVAVDLETEKVVRDFKLRSEAYDFAVDEVNGIAVTAQSGGVGPDADDRLGVVDIRGNQGIHYVKLPKPNPMGVEVPMPGFAVVDHGWYQSGGMFACTVDTGQMKVIKTGLIEDNNVPLHSAGGLVWSSGNDAITGRLSLRRVDAMSLESTEALEYPVFPYVLTSNDSGMYGWLTPEIGRGDVARFNCRTGAVEASAAVELDHGCGMMASTDDFLVAVDFEDETVQTAPSRLLVFDAKTLEFKREVAMSGPVTDVAVWRDRVVALDRKEQSLVIVDPETGRVERTIPVPGLKPGIPQVEVMDG